MYSSNWNYFEN